MNKEQLQELGNKRIACHLLHAAVNILESVPDVLPEGMVQKWIEQILDESRLQIGEHDELREKYLSSANAQADS